MNILEICVDTAQAALQAQQAGADRIELCANLPQGGTTPSYGMIEATRNIINIPLHVIIRPRAGDFLYSGTEFAVMQADIQAAKQLGADSVVIGILLPDGSVDVERTKQLVELAKPMSVTFHRAFDMTADPVQALEDVISTGADRLLTSGLQPTAIDGRNLIRSLITQAAGRISIMPGAGINASNVRELILHTGAREIHMSAGVMQRSSMQYTPNHLHMGNADNPEFTLSVCDCDKIKQVKELIK